MSPSRPNVYKTQSYSINLIIYKFLQHSFIFCGDFNLLEISWSNDKHNLSYSSRTNIRFPYIPKTLAFHCFYQLNYILNSHGSLLDLIFCINLSVYIQHSIDSPIKYDPYYPVLTISYSTTSKTLFTIIFNTFYIFIKANYMKISDFLYSFN